MAVRRTIISLLIVVLIAGVASAAFELGTLKVETGAGRITPPDNDLSFVGYVRTNVDLVINKMIITEQYQAGEEDSYHVRNNEGVWLVNTANLGRGAETSGKFYIDFHAQGKKKTIGPKEIKTGVSFNNYVLNEADILARPQVSLDPAGLRKVRVSWAKVAGANSYTIYRGKKLGLYKSIKVVAGEESQGTTYSYVDGLKKNGRYHYIVVAQAGRNFSAHSVHQVVSLVGGRAVVPKEQKKTVSKPKVKKIKFVAANYIVNKKKGQKSASIKIKAVDEKGKEVTLTVKPEYSVSGGKYGNSMKDDEFIAGKKEGNFTLTTKIKVNGKVYSTTTTVYVDFGPPKLIIKDQDGKELKAGQIISASKFKAIVDAQDGNGIRSVTAYLDGKKISSTTFKSFGVDQEKAQASYAAGTGLKEGNHTLVVEAVDSLGNKETTTIKNLKVYASSSVTGTPMNYPNPFKPSSQSTTINYTLTTDTDVKFYIYTLERRLIYTQDYATGVTGGQAGENEITWTGRDVNNNIVANGVYIYFITSAGKILGSGELSVYE